MTLTTSRLTTPLALRGSSICSQRATRNPWRTRRATYAAAAWWGTPHMGTGWPSLSFEREVRAISRAFEATTASSKNSS